MNIRVCFLYRILGWYLALLKVMAFIMLLIDILECSFIDILHAIALFILQSFKLLFHTPNSQPSLDNYCADEFAFRILWENIWVYTVLVLWFEYSTCPVVWVQYLSCRLSTVLVLSAQVWNKFWTLIYAIRFSQNVLRLFSRSFINHVVVCV